MSGWTPLWFVGIGFVSLLLIVLVILLVRYYLSHLVDRRIAVYQNDLISKQMNEVENMYRQMRGWRHDFHNHIQTMQAFLELGRLEELSGYLVKLNDDLTNVDQVLKTGNVMTDAILNSKLSLAMSKEIKIHAKATVPEELRISAVDLCVIIGNLLDNAMEACSRISDPEKRFIRIYIGVLKQQLYISITNSTEGIVKQKGGFYHTSKAGMHGFGLMRIDRIAKRCGGYVNRQSDEGVFATEIMMPL